MAKYFVERRTSQNECLSHVTKTGGEGGGTGDCTLPPKQTKIDDECRNALTKHIFHGIRRRKDERARTSTGKFTQNMFFRGIQWRKDETNTGKFRQIMSFPRTTVEKGRDEYMKAQT